MNALDRQIALRIEAIMEEGRELRPAPDVVRARLMGRARAAFAASLASPAPLPAPAPRIPWHGRRIAVAAGLLLVLATAAAGAALHARATRDDDVDVAPATRPVPAPQPPIRGAARTIPAAPPAVLPSSARTQRAHRTVTPQESYAAELQLLQRAQSEYARHDFANALVLVAEHGRRFPNGRLAEEREALRVRSLARAGRGDEARRALTAFAGRFPHSAFLPRLREAARSAEE